MTLSARDKKIVTFMVPLLVLFAYWFLLLAPKREAASQATITLEAEQARLMDAEAQANTVQAAKTNFARDYAAVVALGKAIPTSVDMPSLLVQLEQAAQGTGIELAGVTVGDRVAVAAPAAATAPTTPGAPDPAASGTAPSGQPPQSAPGAAVASAQGAADAATAPPAPSDPAAAAATPVAAGAPAATPAAGALESVSLEFDFKGDFFELADFFHSLKRFVFVDGDKVRVRGRLMTIDSVEYVTEAESFPALNATVSATVYLTPKAEGVTAGATAAGPPTAPSAAAPVTTTASDGSTPPTPTATATTP